MGIRVSCPNGHTLHVKEFLAGKRGICPSCGAKFDIPAAPESAAAARPSQASVATSGSPSSGTISRLEKSSAVIPVVRTGRAPATGVPVAPTETPVPQAAQAIPAVDVAPLVEPTPAVMTGADRTVSPAIKYMAHRERARRNRTKFAVLLLLAVIVLAAMLAWILTAGPPTISNNASAHSLQPNTQLTTPSIANSFVLQPTATPWGRT